jgi:DNA-binding IclR family transcriptional regulator
VLPFFDCVNKVAASLTISGPTERSTEKKIPLFTSLVKEAAEKISVSPGHQPQRLNYSNK